MSDTTLHLRPHHGLCILNFTGNGYDAAFTKKMTETAALLSTYPETEVILTRDCDDLCALCPNRDGTHCQSARPSHFDRTVLEKTGFSYSQLLSWQDLIEKTNPLSLYELDAVCPDCQWLDLCRKIAASRGGFSK